MHGETQSLTSNPKPIAHATNIYAVKLNQKSLLGGYASLRLLVHLGRVGRYGINEMEWGIPRKIDERYDC